MTARPALPLVLPLALLASGGAFAQSFEPVIDETQATEYYDFEADDAGDILDALNSHTVLGYAAETYSEFGFSGSYWQDETGCHLSGLTITLHLDFVYPRWTNEERAPRRVRQQWQRYMEALTNHEEGHAEISRRGAAIIAQRLAATPTAPDCANLDYVLGENFRILNDALQVSQENYDDETDHGRTHGAWIEVRQR